MDLEIIYYTSNHLDKMNPYFVRNTRQNLLETAGDIPIISVSQKPMKQFGTNVDVGEIGRSHLNIYWQIYMGALKSQAKWVAMAEDDILYSRDHWHPEQWIKDMRPDRFYYDMNKVSIFTWTKPPCFSFRTKRKVINQLIAPRRLLVEALEERFNRLEELRKTKTDEQIIKYWGDIGRYERLLGVSVQPVEEYYSWTPSVVFSHEFAFGFEHNQGKKKKLGDLRIIELKDWGRAEQVLEAFYPEGQSFPYGRPK